MIMFRDISLVILGIAGIVIGGNAFFSWVNPDSGSTPKAQVAALEKKLNGQFENLAATHQDCETVALFLEGTTVLTSRYDDLGVPIRFVKHVAYSQEEGVCSGTVVSEKLRKPLDGFLFAAVSHRPGQVYCYGSLSDKDSFWQNVSGKSLYRWELSACNDLYGKLVAA